MLLETSRIYVVPSKVGDEKSKRRPCELGEFEQEPTAHTMAACPPDTARVSDRQSILQHQITSNEKEKQRTSLQLGTIHW